MAALATVEPKKSLVAKFADRFGVDASKMLDTLKHTAFRQDKGEVTNEQMMALLVVADQYRLNPFTKELYAFPDKHNGIVPVVGVDGWARIINEHPEFDGMEFNEGEVVEQAGGKPCPQWIECVIFRKDRNHATKVKEYLDECFRPMGAWQSHTKRMLRHKALMQCARIAFGFVGIYDPDEAERIIEGDVVVSDPETGSQADKLNRIVQQPAEEEVEA